jgi:spore germination cell wall hydrolase CwlJ-like protein
MKKLICAIAMGATAIVSAADNVVAKTIYAEARGEGRRGMLCLASVVYNRAKGDASKLEVECLRFKQFSCWNGRFDIEVDEENPAWATCLEIEKMLKRSEFSPITKARHFYARNITTPRWARGCQSELVGNHYFVEGVR